jgi:hypothetical protein
MESIKWMTENNKLGSVWKEAVVAQFEIISCHWPGMTKDKHGKLQSGQRLLVFSP